MAYKRIEELSGNEVLDREILTSDYQILLPKGAVLKKEYIDKLHELGIFAVYIKEDDSPIAEEIAILKTDVEKAVKTRIKDILEHHTYQKNEELMELCGTADNIISTIMNEQQVMETVYDIKQRNTDIYEHSLTVCTLSIITALKLELPQKKVHDIGVGCLLHDIGLRYLTLDYGNQDLSNLSEADIAEYRKHPIYGYSSLKNEKWISDISKNIILYHHERMDGSGYPLRARSISLEVGIVMVMDAFDERICGIGFEKSKVHEVLTYLKKEKDKKFPGVVIDAFLEIVAMYPAGTKVLTSDGETAIVIRQNKGFPDRPVLRIVVDKLGNNITRDWLKDLKEIEGLFIECVVD